MIMKRLLLTACGWLDPDFSIWAKKQYIKTGAVREESKLPALEGGWDSPAMRQKQPFASIYSGGHPFGKELCTKGPGGPGGLQAEQEPATCPCHYKGKGIIGCTRKNLASLLSEMILLLCQALVRPTWITISSTEVPSTREKWIYWRQSNKDFQDDEGNGASLLWRKRRELES